MGGEGGGGVANMAKLHFFKRDGIFSSIWHLRPNEQSDCDKQWGMWTTKVMYMYFFNWLVYAVLGCMSESQTFLPWTEQVKQINEELFLSMDWKWHTVPQNKSYKHDWLTVCAVAERGVLCTGVFLLLLLSHNTIWPEYVPPTIKLGWNLANVTDVTPD